MNPLTGPVPFPAKSADFAPIVEKLRHRWGWFIVIGLLIIMLGLAALLLVVTATIASVFAIAVFMIIAGGAEIVMGFNAHNWCRFFLWIFGGLAYIGVGAFALAQPLMAAAVFTLVLGAGLLATGVLRIYVGSHLGGKARWPAILAGCVTALVGAIVLIGWPANSFIALGLLLGIDLIFWGASWLALGVHLRSHMAA